MDRAESPEEWRESSSHRRMGPRECAVHIGGRDARRAQFLRRPCRAGRRSVGPLGATGDDEVAPVRRGRGQRDAGPGPPPRRRPDLPRRTRAVHHAHARELGQAEDSVRGAPDRRSALPLARIQPEGHEARAVRARRRRGSRAPFVRERRRRLQVARRQDAPLARMAHDGGEREDEAAPALERRPARSADVRVRTRPVVPEGVPGPHGQAHAHADGQRRLFRRAVRRPALHVPEPADVELSRSDGLAPAPRRQQRVPCAHGRRNGDRSRHEQPLALGRIDEAPEGFRGEQVPCARGSATSAHTSLPLRARPEPQFHGGQAPADGKRVARGLGAGRRIQVRPRDRRVHRESRARPRSGTRARRAVQDSDAEDRRRSRGRAWRPGWRPRPNRTARTANARSCTAAGAQAAARRRARRGGRMMRRDAIVAAVTLFAVACAPPPKPNLFGNFLKNRPEPTDSAITEKDLKTRMYVFADDSMMGRQAGREGNTKATAYIARELGRLGVTPAGDNGTYFQNMPWMARHYAATSTLTVGSRTLRWLTDWAAVPGATPAKGFDGVRAIYGGAAGDTSKQITAQQAQGKFVILTTGTPVAGGAAAQAARLGGAAAVAVVDLQTLSANSRALYVNPPAALVDPAVPAVAPP